MNTSNIENKLKDVKNFVKANPIETFGAVLGVASVGVYFAAPKIAAYIVGPSLLTATYTAISTSVMSLGVYGAFSTMFTAVAHSSGPLILSGAGGYIAGTLGTVATAAVAVATASGAVAVVAGATAASLVFAKTAAITSATITVVNVASATAALSSTLIAAPTVFKLLKDKMGNSPVVMTHL